MSYDRAITVFSPDGHLFQVEYAMEAVRRGSTAIGIKAKDCVVLAVERRALAKLQDPRTIRKIVTVDARTTLAFSGLTADARVLINKARNEAQSYRLTCEDDPSIEYLARFIARTQQKYTQRGGVRPFGIASLVAGFDLDVNTGKSRPVLYQTDPAGTHSRWNAQVIGGRNSKSLREFLEKNYDEEMEERAAVKLGVQALLEVVDSGAKNMEICVIKNDGKAIMGEDDVNEIVKEIEIEIEENKKSKKGSTSDE
mmetsp:Transcript_1795/g.2677  ORF Transcript_1795/g.2677 Transcript_1795/m.2677 type:complete len:254 (-) Transcript_1795:110-871(-)|eukprot:CAMPEP_0197247954 /NCGR_PEP_ID=MMETSP1429-20130617/32577_1 /TAXON_ID=49237 /ORGANISM="Chaetoceros  sp., Strain UNC1202" /LENGTH=253 /DNA_ID=CAMNT_0042709007 /DNA_START=81 /DNA_END=842 /DNA_ORIENTATION=-